jgi:D-glycero-alpha-D-manno-heptose 1-phosphate guanylyltransferase
MKKAGMKTSTAIVLAGGLGTRLQTILPDRPKVLAEVAGHPFLYYILQYLNKQEIHKIILSLGYHAPQVIDFIEQSAPWEATINFVIEEKPLGTAGALRLASQSLSESFFALNGDTLFLVDLHKLDETHQKFKPLVTLALTYAEKSEAKGCVQLESNSNPNNYEGNITLFTEKPPQKGPALINGGIYIIEPEVLSGVILDHPSSLENDIFPSLANQGKLFGQLQDAYFIDIGTPQGLATIAQDIFEDKIPGFGKGKKR